MGGGKNSRRGFSRGRSAKQRRLTDGQRLKEGSDSDSFEPRRKITPAARAGKGRFYAGAGVVEGVADAPGESPDAAGGSPALPLADGWQRAWTSCNWRMLTSV